MSHSFHTLSYFHLSYSCFFLGGKYNCLHAESMYNYGKVLTLLKHQNLNANSSEKYTTFPSIASLIGRVLSIFRQKMDGHNPSEIVIKVFIQSATFSLQKEQCLFENWKKLNNSLIGKMKRFLKN